MDFPIFRFFHWFFATVWLSSTSSRVVNTAKSLDLRCWLNKNLSKSMKKLEKSKNPYFSLIWISIKYACMQYQFDKSIFAIVIKSKTFLSLRKLSFNHFWSTTGSGVDRIHKESADFPGFSEMCPTLKSCISELNEYFLMGPVPLQRSMSKLYNAPNTIKNGHLAQKLRSMKGRGFSGKCEKELKHPH